MAYRAIGLDIGSSALRAVQLTFGHDGVQLEVAGEVTLPPGAVVDGIVAEREAVKAALKRLWKDMKFSSRQVHLGVANQRVVVRELSVPTMPAADLALALPYQVKDVLPMPVESAVLDFHPLAHTTSASGAAMTRGLLVAAARDMVLANVETVQSAGLTVASIDLAPFAVLRAVGARLTDEPATEALLEIGSQITSIVIHRDGLASFVRILLGGGLDLTEAIADEAATTIEAAESWKVEHGLLGDADALETQALRLAVRASAEGVRSTLDHFAASHPGQFVDRIVLTGGGAQLLGLADELSDYLRIPVRVGDPATYLSASERHSTEPVTSPRSAVSVGLALGVTR